MARLTEESVAVLQTALDEAERAFKADKADSRDKALTKLNAGLEKAFPNFIGVPLPLRMLRSSLAPKIIDGKAYWTVATQVDFEFNTAWAWTWEAIDRCAA